MTTVGSTMRRRHLAGLAAAALMPVRRAMAQAPPRWLHLQRVEIMDPYGFEQPVPAASLLAPVGWRLQGGIAWAASLCPTDMVSARATLASPDGRYGFEFLPAKLWSWSQDPFIVQMLRQQAAQGQGCAAAPPIGAMQALRQLVLPGLRPGAQVLGAEADPAAAAAMRDALAAMASLRPQSEVQADAARLRLAWAGHEEWLTGGVSVVSYAALSPSVAAQGGMGYTRNQDISLQNLYAFRTPMGGLDAAQPLLATMLSSIRRNPVWDAAVMQVMSNIAQVVQRGVMDRARIWRDAQQQVGEMQRQGWQQRQDTQDRVAHAFGQVIRGVETYLDPTGVPVELAAGYGRAWSNGRGEYIVSSEPAFDPAQQLNGNWTEMRREGR